MTPAFRHITLLFLALMWAGLSVAQDDRLTITVDKTDVGLNDQIVLKITLKNIEGKFQRPDFSEFMLLQGPMTSTSTQIINGKMTKEMSETFVLRPKKTGAFQIGPAKASTGVEELTSNVVKINVSQASPKSAETNSDFFVKVEVNKKQAWVGEGIQALFKIYSVYENIERFDQNDYPTLTGFWTEEIPIDKVKWEPRKEIINGKAYSVAIMRKVMLYPQHAGEMEVGPYNVSCQVAVSRSFWDVKRLRFSDSTSPVKISVKALPGGQPANFIGTFENLSLSLTADRTDVKTNDAIDVKLKFSGKGNFKTLGNIKLDFPDEFEIYDPTVKDNLTLTEAGQSGSRIFGYVVIPRSPGSFDIENLTYGWFDYKAGQYRTLKAAPLLIRVERGNESQSGGYSINPKTQVNLISSDIRYIITNAESLAPCRKPFFASVPYLGLMAGLPALAMLFVFFTKIRDRRMADKDGQRKSKAARLALKKIKAAATMDSRKAYAEIAPALEQFVRDKFLIPVADADTDRLLREVETKAGRETAASYKRLLEECRMASYGGAATGTSPQSAASDAEQIIRTIDRA
jgi:hypothetical protein